ncbi:MULTISPECIES: hypothetical protein [unclassified Kitasatospora]|uniref:hypothetical protein n=1 Tax=unclassified Kitasatospora TaxID=2633591 RepID=UPI001F43E2B1|nr:MULTISPECIES: hypothetical protein [unclassified Kitasatospora]
MAMIVAKARFVTKQSERFAAKQGDRFVAKHQSARQVSEETGLTLGRIGLANTVLQHAPDLIDPVITGALTLDEAYKTARETKAQADSVENRLARLRAEDAELADKVVEGELSLAAAWTERKERAEEEVRQRRVATQFLCEVVPPLAQARGTDTVRLYDQEFMLTGRAITSEVIDQAMEALAEMAQAWREREAA